MQFKIPFAASEIDKLKKRSEPFRVFFKLNKNSKLSKNLKSANINLNDEEYKSIVLRAFVFVFLSLVLIFGSVLLALHVSNAIAITFGGAFLFSLFIVFSQMLYPKFYSNRRQKDIERNLIHALEDIMVQLNSGVPLFDILINISSSDYGELSVEFKKMVRRINAGLPQVDVLEEAGENNSSVHFKRVLWQISNGMRAGSDISIVIRDSINSLGEEQLIQIQNYGNKLNPLIMFYMLISVIIPALAVTFLTIIASMVNLAEFPTKMLYVSLLVLVLIMQVMFLGIIKSSRPSLLN